MHELSIARSVLDVALRHAAGRRLTAIDVQIGELRQVVPSALSFNFDLVAEGTLAQGADLRLEPVPAVILCRACGSETDQADVFPTAVRKLSWYRRRNRFRRGARGAVHRGR